MGSIPMFDLFAALAAGYLLGGIPTAELIARLRGTSIFTVGSGNMGAMNTARHLGAARGVLVLAIDLAKGAAATALGLWMAGVVGAGTLAGLTLALVAGLGAVAGHAWSPYVRFRGGKALATLLGVSLPLYPLAGLFGLMLMVALLLLLRRATPAAMLALGLYPFVVLFTLFRQGVPEGVAFAVFTGVVPMAVISLVKHVQARREPSGPV